jgi:2-polyprenyl-3-methyl-5-hydroxy-6-metoxy-1,4-benzoquinol methylase
VVRTAKRIVFARLARALGIPEVQTRLDNLDSKSRRGTSFLPNSGQVSDPWELNLFASELRLKDYIEVRIADLEERIDRNLAIVEERLSEKLLAQSGDLTSLLRLKIEEAVAELSTRIDQEHAFVEVRSDDLATASSAFTRLVQEEIFQFIDELSAKLTRSIDSLRSTRNLSANHPASSAPMQQSEFSDDLYQLFEDRFRGSEKEIQARQRFYLQYVERAPEPTAPVVDIGCGRGEWLTELRERGIKSFGIDSNVVSVERCQHDGLDVRQEEALSFLNSVDPASIRVITLFQVIEHLSLGNLIEMLRASLVALKPGGVWLAEFPNIQMLSVGASSFWLDPTHVRPLHPLLVSFIAEQVGFKRVEIVYPSQSQDAGSGSNTSPDVAVIATK